MTETNKERRVRVANKIRVLASPLRMPREQFEHRYMQRELLASPEARDQLENTTQEMFCDECVKPGPHGSIEVAPLHVLIEDDPLQNFWKIATLRCFCCGFNELVPLSKPDFSADPDPSMNLGNIQAMPAHSHSLTGMGANPLLGAAVPFSVWDHERQVQFAERAAKRNAQLAAQKQQATMAQLKQFQQERKAKVSATEIEMRMRQAQRALDRAAQQMDSHAVDAIRYQMEQMGRQMAEENSPKEVESIFKRIFG